MAGSTSLSGRATPFPRLPNIQTIRTASVRVAHCRISSMSRAGRFTAADPVPGVARDFVLEHLAEIAAVDPAAASGAPDEVLGLILRGIAEKLPDVVAAGACGRRV
jgi:hypothetical protein